MGWSRGESQGRNCHYPNEQVRGEWMDRWAEEEENVQARGRRGMSDKCGERRRVGEGRERERREGRGGEERRGERREKRESREADKERERERVRE